MRNQSQGLYASKNLRPHREVLGGEEVSEHTAGPWFAVLCESQKHNGSVCAGTLNKPIYIAMTTRGGDSEEGMNARDADSEHIVRCVNAHDGLVAALAGMLKFFDKPKRDEWINDESFQSAQRACKTAHEALAAAGVVL